MKSCKIHDLQKKMRILKNPTKANVLAGFFKTGKGQYGEGDKFLGLTAVQIRRLAKEYWEIPQNDILQILESKFHEERLAALLVMVFQFEKGNEKTRKNIFNLYLKNTNRINSWDLVDLTAHRIVGAYLSDKSKDILCKLVESQSLWERRIAILATFYDIKLGRSGTTLLLAEKLLKDKEDLMHKAVGWMLREVGKRCSQKEEEVFLQKNWHKMSRTTLRYAIERFDEKKRLQYLKRKL
ncbi:MAG: alkylation repair enzyme protein [Candidatus Moranbacteria bacterium GW2011_GWE1_36_7]|nr:MAG: alkylation repair enzyme protein [Candidatus Moranbacteria bacterium GW2011_GWD2_36_12]KKQ06082.1 MAG: alkylation repair enzyme protein [Candidatus Moranbacteria bacterium GW2011_GWE2_36_40]KKQ14958.1 MAG: alkylation repair enzyme protein [Candidatus Moranbacteria bacterium GW2011_GWE1_36_7]